MERVGPVSKDLNFITKLGCEGLVYSAQPECQVDGCNDRGFVGNYSILIPQGFPETVFGEIDVFYPTEVRKNVRARIYAIIFCECLEMVRNVSVGQYPETSLEDERTLGVNGVIQRHI